MMATTDSEYRKLALDSSNLLMDWDGKWGLGRYEESTDAVLQAGQMRRRMGEMSIAFGNCESAAGDWLSSAACFAEATALQRAKETFGRVKKLEAAGRIPPERQDLLAALREREVQIQRLERKIQAFLNQHSTPSHPDEQSLAALLHQVRALPGLPLLHRLIAKQASGLGRSALAAVHQRWAEVFAGESGTNGSAELNFPPPLVDPGLASAAPKDR